MLFYAINISVPDINIEETKGTLMKCAIENLHILGCPCDFFNYMFILRDE